MPDTEPDAAGLPSPADRIEVGIVISKRILKGPWASHAWLPTAALPAPVPVPVGTRLNADAGGETFYAGAFTLALHPSETPHYRDNLVSGRPSLWVALRPTGGDEHEVAAVTADPYEGESMAEGIGEIVEAVPMPVDIQVRIAAFVEAFHVERPFVKRKRDRADREALARGESGSKGRGRA